MNITPNKLSIAQLFATPNEQFIVPSYQRRYAWGYNQYCALYEDIDMLKENDGHLFGMIILHTSFYTAGINQPELVDGQQRMTTLVLFLKAFEYVYREKGKEDKANEIKKMIICKGLDDIERPKIKLGDLDNKDIENLVLKNQFHDLENKNIRFAINDYIKWLTELEIDDLNRLFFKLTNIAVIIRLDVGMAQDAYKLFETINNRGLKLKPTDIIKNFLLGHAAKINQNAVLEEVKNLWSKVIVNLDDLDSDDFLRQFMSSILQRKITMTLLVVEFKKYYLKNVEFAELLGEFEYYQEDDYFEDDYENEEDTLEDIEIKNENQFTIVEFLEKLVKLSEVYRKISLAKHESVKINRKLRNLNQILSKSTYIFLMHFLLESKHTEREKLSVLKYIETLMLRRHICERRTNENDDIFSKLVGFIGNDDILNKIKNYINEEGYIPDDNDFEVYFPKHQFKGKLIDRAKYVLESIEYFKRGNTDELVIASNQEVHLEHIIPQTISTKKSKLEYGNWEEYLGEKSISKHKKYVNFIGNMTLLGESLNIQAYNNPFAKKKGSYKVSNLLITNELSHYSDFKFSHVDKRSETFTEIALKIWKI
ncbi:DUF262 domain-containing HNH endonuclease family protein [Flavobacterium sp.]|uniref:DUF262 domain-containing protein n=1 Tax=Flavobacterium sp. TaxID=239 RepID=UPI0022C884DB|nr:DUF262 domain-containing HNH endonuclease family protein [Flavobacterium sp.]MCZ8089221.1 DUF262 domain-containing HNH endonuclease family protein [Flavobacterium sp.]